VRPAPAAAASWPARGAAPAEGTGGARPVLDWLPEGRKAAVCFSIDDLHPSTSAHPYEAGGDLGGGGLGRVARLIQGHPRLRVTLFVTPDWRPLSLHPTRRLLARVPLVRDRVHLAKVRPEGGMRIDRFPEFVRYLNGLPRAEVAVHGLHHLHTGTNLTIEFQEQDRARCTTMLRKALAIFEASGLRHVRGFQPPGWNLPPPLVEALDDLNFTFAGAARDLTTPVAPRATVRDGSFRNVALIHPEFLRGRRLLHFPVNFQATSHEERALQIVEQGGLLSIKAHIFKSGGGHVLLDGLDEAYCRALDSLFDRLERRFGESLWWTSFGEIADRVRGACPTN
jgi:hypothetical protein